MARGLEANYFGFVKLTTNLFFTGSGWEQQIFPAANPNAAPHGMSMLHSIGKYPERQFSHDAAVEHGTRMRHQSKDPKYVAKLGVSNGVKGSGNPYIDTSLSTQNHTVLVGKQIILRCHIEDAGNQSVRRYFCYLNKAQLIFILC